MQVDFLLSKHSNHLRYVLLLIITPTYYILDSQDKEAEHFFFVIDYYRNNLSSHSFSQEIISAYLFYPCM